MSDTEDRVRSLVAVAMSCEALDELIEPLERALDSDDPWLVNAGILAIGHAARRLKAYPRTLKDALWARSHHFQPGAGPNLAGTRADAEADIRHFKAKGV